MPHRKYVHLAGNLSGWPLGFVPSPATLRNLDQHSSELVNGDDGGTYSPETPIVIGPYGVPTVNLSNAGSLLSGDVETVKGNRLDTSCEPTPGLVLLGGAVPALSAGVLRSVAVPFTSWDESRVVAGVPLIYLLDGEMNFYALDPVTLSMTALSGMDLFTVGNTVVVTVPLPQRAMHRAATIERIDVRFRVNGQQRVLPATLPSIRVLRVRPVPDAQFALHTAAGGYDANGWLVDTAATVAAYTFGGEPRTLSYIPDQYNTAIDPTQEFYLLQMRGSTAPWVGSSWLSATVSLSGIVDMRQE